jgi:hypothetical protein
MTQQNTDTKSTMAATTLEQLFQAPHQRQQATAASGWDSLRIEDIIFTGQDVELITQVGVTLWALRKAPAQMEDRPLDWPALPNLLRHNILTNVIEAVGQELHYVVSFRHVGRVLTFALLPAEREPIKVIPATGKAPAPAAIYRDPPVPFLTLGLADASVQDRHGRLVRQVLNQPETAQINPAVLLEILQAMARTGEATASEVFYYLTQLRALVSGAWRYLAENYGLLAVEYLVRHAASDHPLQPQLLAQAHLVEGRPIDWGEADPLRIAFKTN